MDSQGGRRSGDVVRQRLSLGLMKEVEQARLCDLARGLGEKLGSVPHLLFRVLGRWSCWSGGWKGRWGTRREQAGMGLRSQGRPRARGGGWAAVPEAGIGECREAFGGLSKGHLHLVGDWRPRNRHGWGCRTLHPGRRGHLSSMRW